MKREPKNIWASVQARLLQRSRDLNVEHQLTLARFGGERLLYRLATSEFADRFILKGAAMLLVWMGDVQTHVVGVFNLRRSFQENAMPNPTRRLVTTTLFTVAALAGSALAYSQVSVRPVPVDPVVLSGNDLGFRMTARKGSTPVGQLVVRVDGQWKEVEFSFGVKPLTQ